VTYGCQPSHGVPALSTIVDSYVKCLSEYLQENGGVLQFPDAMRFFKSDFEKAASMRDDLSQILFYDVAGKQAQKCQFKTTTPKETKRLNALRSGLNNRFNEKMKSMLSEKQVNEQKMVKILNQKM
jgi:hypothetical protein